MKRNRILPILAGTLALAALPAFANNDHDNKDKLKMLDTDGDGRVSRAEFVAGKQQHLQQSDANHDGVVTPGESSTPASTPKKHWWSRSDKSTDSDKANMADANGDGQVTADEAATYAGQKFAELDSDNDGYLTAAELDAGRDNRNR